MKFQLTTDYAIRIIGFLYRNQGRLVTAQEVADEVSVTYQIFMKVSSQLKKGKLLKTTQGCMGGYSLVKRGEEISLYDIIELMEGPITVNRCLQNDRHCSGDFTTVCPVHKTFADLQRTIINTLSEVHISDLWTLESSPEDRRNEENRRGLEDIAASISALSGAGV